MSDLKRTCYHIGNEERAALNEIRQALGIQSDALIVRLAIKRLRNHLKEAQPRSGAK